MEEVDRSGGGGPQWRRWAAVEKGRNSVLRYVNGWYDVRGDNSESIAIPDIVRDEIC